MLTSELKRLDYRVIDITPYSTTCRVLALSRFAGVTPRLMDALLRRFRTLEDILLAEKAELAEIEGINKTAIDRIDAAASHLPEAEKIERSMSEREINLMSRFDDLYPRLLFDLNDPPSMLYVRGKLPEADKRTVALVGTEKASGEGIEMTSRLAKQFSAQKIQLVSSMVGGIDSAAHLAAKAAGGASFAVLNAGLDEIAITSDMPVAIDIVQNGGVISEYPPENKFLQENIAQSNRLLVGLSQAVVVTEAYEDSGRILDLLQFCEDVGKLVFFMIDPEFGAFADELSLKQALECGAVPIKGYDGVQDIIKSLV